MTETTDTAALRVEIDTPGIGSVAQLRRLAHKLMDELEAERQRADYAHKYGSERDAENESLMLTVGRLRVEIAELKGKLANPVMLPERWKPCDCIDCAYAYDSEATKKAINEAGFTVKGDL